MLRILTEEKAHEVGGIMHCFSGDVDIARRCLDLGIVHLAGRAGDLSERARAARVARFVPGDRLVIETDCPFLPPQGYRGQRNEPAYLAVTAAKVAELRGEALEQLAARAVPPTPAALLRPVVTLRELGFFLRGADHPGG